MIDLLLILMGLMLLASIGLVAWSVLRSRDHVSRPFVWTFTATAILMLLVLLIRRSVVEMFMLMSLVLILVATILVIYGNQAKRTRNT